MKTLVKILFAAFAVFAAVAFLGALTVRKPRQYITVEPSHNIYY